MPTITATPFPALGRVLVEVNWADTDFATCARVVRTVTATGVTGALRTYINPCTFPGEYQELSGGRAIFWDNECPLDTAVTYATDAVNSSGTQINIPPTEFSDLFTRVVAAGGWGTATSGQAWSVTAGAAAVLSVNGTQGLHTHSVANTPAECRLPVTGHDGSVRIDAAVSSVADYGEMGLALRYVDSNNWVRALYQSQTGVLLLQQRSAGTTTTLSTSSTLITATTSLVSIALAVTGSAIQGKVWITGTAEPGAFQLSSTLTAPDIGGGGVGVTSSDLTTAKTFTFDNLQGSAFPVAAALTATTGSITLVSNNTMWLRDPGRPCNDLNITLCFTAPCVSGGGISFMAEDQETYDANTTLVMPTNAKFPIPVNRLRRSAASSLTLATKTFTDRDALLQIIAPGSPLLLCAPTVYGIPDRYMTINQATVSRGLSDHRIQRRLETLPFTTVERPITTQQGTCAAQFSAMCTLYSTWGAMNAADVTWTKILYGEAGNQGLGFRQWNPGVENVFANWLAVKVKTWGQLKTGA